MGTKILALHEIKHIVQHMSELSVEQLYAYALTEDTKDFYDKYGNGQLFPSAAKHALATSRYEEFVAFLEPTLGNVDVYPKEWVLLTSGVHMEPKDPTSDKKNLDSAWNVCYAYMMTLNTRVQDAIKIFPPLLKGLKR